MRNWCARHPIYFMGLYALFYLTFFALLERTIQTPDLLVHCRLDDLIPFCKYAIIPYSLWFPWIPFTLFFILYKGERSDFWRLCLPLFAGMTMALLFYAIVPNGLALRPRYVPGNDIFSKAVQSLLWAISAAALVSSQAAAKPQIPGRFSVPERKFPSCPPPWMNGGSGRLGRM